RYIFHNPPGWLYIIQTKLKQEYQKKEKEWEDCLEDCKKKNANKASYVHNDFAQCFTDCKHLDPRPGTPRAKGLHSSVNSGRKYIALDSALATFRPSKIL
ncbi:hypothetical protein OOU_Y34scaffold01161g1, partial [Pyricularia oryzae Y34]